VNYSDTPHRGAIEMDVPTDPAGIIPVPPEKMRAPRQPAAEESVESYGMLTIVSPTNDQVLDNPKAGSTSPWSSSLPCERIKDMRSAW